MSRIDPHQIPELADLERDPNITVLELLPLALHRALMDCEAHKRREALLTGTYLGVTIAGYLALLTTFDTSLGGIIAPVLVIALFQPLIWLLQRDGITRRAAILDAAKAAHHATMCPDCRGHTS